MRQLRLRSILVFVPPERKLSFAIQQAIDLLDETGGTITVVTAFDGPRPWLSAMLKARDLEEKYIRDLLEALKQLVSRYSNHKGDMKTKLLRGRPYVEVVREVIRSGHDIVMMDVEGESSDSSAIVSGLDWRLFRNCPCPVWLMQPTPKNRGMAVAIAPGEEDKGIEFNQRLLESAMQLAERTSQDLHVIQAWELIGHTWVMRRTTPEQYDDYMKSYEAKVAKELSAFLEPYGFSPSSRNVHLVEGPPEKVVPWIANELRLNTLVIGTIARVGIAGHTMGNTAERVINQTACSILAMKPEGWKSALKV